MRPALVGSLAVLVVLATVPLSADDGIPQCEPVWTSGPSLVRLVDGTPMEIARASSPILAFAACEAGHIAFAAGGTVFVLPAGAKKPVKLSHPKLAKGRYTHAAELQFLGDRLVVTMHDPEERASELYEGPSYADVDVPLPRAFRCACPEAGLPTLLLQAAAGVKSAPTKRSPSGDWRIEESVVETKAGRFPRLVRHHVPPNEPEALLVDVLDVNRALGFCEEPERDCAGWALDAWGWLPGDHVWARLVDLGSVSRVVYRLLPADGTAAVDCADLNRASGDHEGRRWLLGCLLCTDEGQCARLPEGVDDAQWAP